MEFHQPIIDLKTYLKLKKGFDELPESMVKKEYNHFSNLILDNYKIFLLEKLDEIKRYQNLIKVIIVFFGCIFLGVNIDIFREFLSKIHLLEILVLSKVICVFLLKACLFYVVYALFKEIINQNKNIHDLNVYQKVLNKHIKESTDYENFIFLRMMYELKINLKYNQ